MNEMVLITIICIAYLEYRAFSIWFSYPMVAVSKQLDSYLIII